MTIVFLCGCLEPGHDGVGDYTRRLAAELQRQQHRVSIIALHDRLVAESAQPEEQPEEEQSVAVLRLSSRLSWQERTGIARTYINTVSPGWVSLQYVPFSFHDKGLSVQLAGMMRQLSAGRRVHIMFHEIWLGLSMQSPRRHVAWGMVQRQLIRALLYACHRPVVHTHTHLYQIHLNGLGIRPAILPLFSNIPVASRRRQPQTITEQPIRDAIRFVFFGGIFPDAPVQQLAAEAAGYAQKAKKRVDLTLIGRSGPEQAVWISAWRAHGLSVHSLGEQPPARISDVLRQSSIGLSTTPVALAGKSGAIAAMHAHGLPVLCITAPWHPRRAHLPIPATGLATYSIGHLEDVLSDKLHLPPARLDITNVATQFITDLTQLR